MHHHCQSNGFLIFLKLFWGCWAILLSIWLNGPFEMEKTGNAYTIHCRKLPDTVNKVSATAESFLTLSARHRQLPKAS
jgi:hypothetical protein